MILYRKSVAFANYFYMIRNNFEQFSGLGKRASPSQKYASVIG